MGVLDNLSGTEGFVRLGAVGAEVPAYLHGGNLHSIAEFTDDITPSFLSDGGLAEITGAFHNGSLAELDSTSFVRIGAPLTGVGKIICIGLNYQDHALETGAKLPDEPIIFFKAANTIIGPTDDIVLPRGSTKVDWEVELAIIICKDALYLKDELEASQVIGGYTISNDLSARDFQLERGGQWVKGKSCPTFNPLGPCLRPSTNFDPSDIGLRLAVNGKQKQDSRTSEMVFSPTFLVWYLSQFMALEAGDIINTGTPAGVALGQADPRYLKTEDRLDVSIDGLGNQQCIVKDP